MNIINSVLIILLSFIICALCANLKYSGKIEIENGTVGASGDCECKNGYCEKAETGKLECKCPPEYGKINANECSKCECGKGVNCTWKGYWDFKKYCICRTGYTEVKGTCKGDCKGTPCTNGGTCRVVENEITCDCVPPYSGDNCEERKEEPCYPNPCHNGATCETDNGKVKCNCKSPYIGDFCDIHQCDKNPCKNGGQCSVVNGKVNCTCKDPYIGDQCEKNQCDRNPCKNGGKCNVVNGKVNCTCKDPYTGDQCEKIDHCASQPCQNGGSCRNRNYTFECICTENYAGKNCSESLWCDKYGHYMCGKEKCEYNKTIGRGYCVCKNSEIFHEPTKTCMVDHCAPQPCQNGGSCRNGNYTFECICTENYGGKVCSESVWCDMYGYYMCGKEKCEYNETIGRGYCVCKNGEMFHESTKTCMVDYCMTQPCQNGGSCRNRNYTFECTCTEFHGGRDCSEYLWCDKYGQDLCNKEKCQYNQTIGRSYCVCENGKIFHESSKTCIEGGCSANHCLNGGVCKDDGDGPVCYCKLPFSGERCEKGPDPCNPNPCKNDGQCANEQGKAKCFCKYGYTGDECVIAPDLCYPNPCKNNGKCENYDGQYECFCKDGYIGNICEIDYRYMIAAVLLFELLAAICLYCKCRPFQITQNFLPQDSSGYKNLPSMSKDF